ncbi:MAG: hypothetical protein R3234_04990 [Thermoanaerobaculia bacterium]|nr:hypothetical protein [Thermoanaerobaculia bacterium]
MTQDRDREMDRDRELFAGLTPTGAPEGLRRRILSATGAVASSPGWPDSIVESRWFRVAVPAAVLLLVLLHAAPGRSPRPPVGERISIDGVTLTRSRAGRETGPVRGTVPLGPVDEDELWTEI